METLWLLLLGFVAFAVVASAIAAGKKNDSYPSHRPSSDELPSDRPVFLGHDKRWTPVPLSESEAAESKDAAGEKVSRV